MSRPGSSSFDLSTPLALIQNRVSSLRAERFPYERPPIAVQPVDVPQLALVEQVLDRERRRQQAERVEPHADLADLLGQLVARPELRLEVGAELVVDHEPRRRERQQALDHTFGERRRRCRRRARRSGRAPSW